MNRVSLKDWLFIIVIVALTTIVYRENDAKAPDSMMFTTNPEIQVTASSTLSPPTLAERAAFNAVEEQLIRIYDSTSPSVVHITNRGFDRRFGNRIPVGGTGTGFVYDKTGHIITNYHVIEDAEELIVTLSDGQQFMAELVGADALNDLAVVRIDAGADLPEPVPIGDSSQVRVGQFVIAIGNPFGLNQTLTTGVVSALGRVIQSPEDNRFIGEVIQTDAAINPGNSGGPLIDLGGEVIGVNSQILSPSGANSGIGFSVSSDTVRRIVPALIANGGYAHPWLGTQLFGLTPPLAEAMRAAGMVLPSDRGIVVIDTVADGPAEDAGVRGSEITRVDERRLPLGGDIISAVDGDAVSGFQDLTVYLETRRAVGDTVELTIIRDGVEQIIPVTLGQQPDSD